MHIVTNIKYFAAQTKIQKTKVIVFVYCSIANINKLLQNITYHNVFRAKPFMFLNYLLNRLTLHEN